MQKTQSTSPNILMKAKKEIVQEGIAFIATYNIYERKNTKWKFKVMYSEK
jgi:hypothetical protein